MKRSVFMLLFGVLVQWVGGSAKAQAPVSGQPYQSPPGTRASVPGRSSATAATTTPSPGTAPCSWRPSPSSKALLPDSRIRFPTGYEGFGPGTLISYGGYNYSIAGDGTMLLVAQGNQSASPQPRYEIPSQGGLSYSSPDGTHGTGGYSSSGIGTNAYGSYSDPQGNRGSGYAQFGGSNPSMGGAYQNADGSSGSGTIGANAGQFAYQYGQYGNGQGTNIGWQGAYQGPNAWGTGMNSYTAGPNGGQTMTGGFSRGPSGYTSSFGVGQVNPQGQTTNRSGTMTYQNPSNWATNYNYAGQAATATAGTSISRTASRRSVSKAVLPAPSPGRGSTAAAT